MPYTESNKIGKYPKCLECPASIDKEWASYGQFYYLTWWCCGCYFKKRQIGI